jgi:subtilisin-like proprotein convertase family protein
MRTTPVVLLAATAAACAVPTDDAAPDRPDGGALALSTDDARVPPRGCTVTTSCVDGKPLARVACLSVPSGHVVHNHERRFENQGRHVYYDIADPWEGEHVAGMCPAEVPLLDPGSCQIFRMQVDLPDACQGRWYEATGLPVAIPNLESVSSDLIAAPRPAALVEVDVAHTWRDYIYAELAPPGRDPVVLHNYQLGLTPDLRRRYFVSDVSTGQVPRWSLRVTDGSDDEDGALRGFRVRPVARCESSAACQHLDTTCRTSDIGSSARDVPDRGTVEATLFVDEAGVTGEVLVDVWLDHARSNDLEITLRAPDGRTAHVWERAGGDSTFPRTRTFAVGDLAGVARQGTWRLTVHDRRAGVTGRLSGFQVRTSPICL